MSQDFAHCPVAWTILVLTIAVSFIAWQSPRLFRAFVLHPYSMVREGKYYTSLTSGLIHGDTWHLAFNMITFYFFAFPLERWLGHMQFLALYVISLVLSDVTTVVKHRDDPAYFCLGASGSVTAVVFSFIIFDPKESIYLFLIPIPIPAVVFGLLFVAYSYLSAKHGQSRINHAAHLWGAVSGLALTLILAPEAYSQFFQTLGLGG